MTRTDAAGAFHFRTIKPIAYPGRTSHIHVRVQAPGVSAFATQLYLADDPGNRRDFLLFAVSAGKTGRSDVEVRADSAERKPHTLARARNSSREVI